MDLHDKELYGYKAQIIKAMAHPSRLMIIDALADGELCVCKLQTLIGCDMSTVSRHLSVLKNAGLVSCRKEGLQVFYSLRVPCILSFFGCVDAVIREDAERRRTAYEVLTAY